MRIIKVIADSYQQFDACLKLILPYKESPLSLATALEKVIITLHPVNLLK